MAQYDINLREYWRILNKRKSIVIITALLLGIFSTIFAVWKAPVPLYTSVCSIKFEKETTLEGLYAKTLSWSGGDDLETQVSVITGYPVLMEVAKNLKLIPQKASSTDPNIVPTIEGLKGKIQVFRESFTNILNIRVTDANALYAQRIANELAKTYQSWHAEQQGKRTTEALKYIDDELKKVREQLKEAEYEFNDFSQKNQLISIDMQSETLLQRNKEIKDLIRKQNEVKREIETLLARVENYLKDPASSDNNFYSTSASPQYQLTNNTLVELILKRDSLLENFTPQHPEVIAISQKIIENARKMVMLLKLQIKNIEKTNADLEKQLAEVEAKTNLLMEKKLEFDRLKREVDRFRNMTALLEQKNQEALIRKAEKPEEVVIVKPAMVSSTPINPPKTLTTGAMGIVIGLVLGLVLAFIMETFDTSLGAIEDVEDTIGAKVLGVIPHTDVKEVFAAVEDRYPGELDDAVLKKVVNLVSHYAPQTMIAESFRALRTNIYSRDTDNKIKTISITSTSPQEGKSLVAANLAISLAQAGLRTLLVGADLRKPVLAKHFGLENSPGLTDVILGNYPWTDTVKTVTDMIMGKMTMDEIMMTPGMDNLHIITSGSVPPNPAELIESNRLQAFIEEVKKEYDIVVFDSTPALSTADAAILGTKVDGVLIVYRVGAVSRGLLKRASTQLEQVKCNIIGVVLNGMKPEFSPDFHDCGYYKYYAYYSQEGKKGKSKGLKRHLSFLSGQEDHKLSGDDYSSTVVGGETSERQRGWKNLILKGILTLMALLLLSFGLLWQNGIIDPIKRLNPLPDSNERSTIKTPVPKRPLNVAPIKNPEALTLKTGLPERDAIDEKSPPAHPDTAMDKEAKSDSKKPTYQSGVFPFSIYLGSFHTKERAEKAIQQYESKGMSPFWVRVNIKDKGVWYRIYTGYFMDEEQANISIKEHGLANAQIKKTVYANLLGTYSAREELDPLIREIKDKGYSPYVIRNQDGRYNLLVGAFMTRTGVEEQGNRLKSEGIQGKAVKR